MDVQSNVNQLKCELHKDKPIEYFKITYLKQSENIFFCQDCMSKDHIFQEKNFVSIKQILNYGENDPFVVNWPPFQSNTILNEIKSIINEKGDEQSNLEIEIISIFDGFKKQINEQIDQCQKAAIKKSQELLILKDEILQKYQEFSQIQRLKELLLSNRLTQQEKSNSIKILIRLQRENETKSSKVLKTLLNKKSKFNEMKTHIKSINENILSSLLKLKKDIEEFIRIQIPYQSQFQKQLDDQSFKDIPLRQRDVTFQQPPIPIEQIPSQQIQTPYITQINKNQITNILPNLQLIKSRFQINTSIEDKVVKNRFNDVISIKSSSNDIERGCYFTNLMIQNKFTNIFRFKSIKFNEGSFIKKYKIVVGISQKKNINFFIKHQSDQLLFEIILSNKCISISNERDIEWLKGDFYDISSEQEIELKINIENRIFSLADYPKNENIITLDEKILDNLEMDNEYVLFISYIGPIDLQITSAYIY